MVKICRDCETEYEEETCPECGGDEVFDPKTDDPNWFREREEDIRQAETDHPLHDREDRGLDERWEREI